MNIEHDGFWLRSVVVVVSSILLAKILPAKYKAAVVDAYREGIMGDF
jgi:hypothetical protein